MAVISLLSGGHFMRWVLAAVSLLGWAMNLQADTFVYVSLAPEQKIQVYRLDRMEGKLTRVETVSVEGSPGSLAVDPRKQYLFASLRTSGSLASFRIERATGKLTALSTARL